MSELKPCPYCGGDAEVYETIKGYTVMCSNGECVELQTSDWTMSKAVSLWNTRTPQSEWISVDDRLPSEDVPVICYSNDIVTGWQVVLFVSDSFWMESSTGAPYPAIVTHWMPLPAPPKQ